MGLIKRRRRGPAGLTAADATFVGEHVAQGTVPAGTLVTGSQQLGGRILAGRPNTQPGPPIDARTLDAPVGVQDRPMRGGAAGALAPSYYLTDPGLSGAHNRIVNRPAVLPGAASMTAFPTGAVAPVRAENAGDSEQWADDVCDTPVGQAPGATVPGARLLLGGARP